ncbi:hypothetical protein ABT348_12735 [Streptomyces olivaceus]|uniref:hypothetical protein n=1 Tax=Streptomyces olivaceus TaxID=47716 RepID=UPI00332179B9
MRHEQPLALNHAGDPMRRKPCTRPGAVALLLAPGAALLLAGCGSGGTGEAAADRPTASPTSGSPTAQAPAPDATRAGGPSASSPSADADLPVDPGPDPGRGAGGAVDEAFGAARSAALQSGLRYIGPALGTPEGLAGVDAKADAQCADLRRNVADPDRLAAQRFSVGNHKVTEADGKRINTLLRNTYCG